MQARPVKAASGSDLARLTAIGNLGVNARPAGFGRITPMVSDTIANESSRTQNRHSRRATSGKGRVTMLAFGTLIGIFSDPISAAVPI
jgi:hypothetical protein